MQGTKLCGCKEIFDDGGLASMPYKRPMTKEGFFRSYDYVYDCVLCPRNKVLKYSTTNREGRRDCVSCPHLEKCTHSKNHQKVVSIHLWNEYIEKVEDIRHTPKGKEMYKLRKETIERVFADDKEKYAMRYIPYRGLTAVTNWVKLKFAAMNLEKLAMWKWKAKNSKIQRPFAPLFIHFNFQRFIFNTKKPVFRERKQASLTGSGSYTHMGALLIEKH